MQTKCDVVRQFIEEVINRGKIDATEQFFWDDMVEQVPLPGQGPGIEGLKGVLRGLKAAFPDMHWTIEEQIAEGDKVLSRFEWTTARFLEWPQRIALSRSGAWCLTDSKAERSRPLVSLWIR
jgi:predicted ester cyclase